MSDYPNNSEKMMRELRQEFMPRESLQITFRNIEDGIEKLSDRLRDLPNEIGKQLDVFSNQMKHMQKDVAILQSLRTAERLDALEKKAAFTDKLIWGAYGVVAVAAAVLKVLDVFRH